MDCGGGKISTTAAAEEEVLRCIMGISPGRYFAQANAICQYTDGSLGIEVKTVNDVYHTFSSAELLHLRNDSKETFRKNFVEPNLNVMFNNGAVIGLTEAKKALNTVIVNPIKKYYSSSSDDGQTNPTGHALLFGATGCSKTLLATAVVNEAHVKCISVTSSNFAWWYSCVTGTKLDALFDVAQDNSPCVIIFDNIEGVFPKSGTSAIYTTLLNVFLARVGCESFKGVTIIGTSSHPSWIHPKVLDKLRNYIYLGLPIDGAERLEILKYAFGPDFDSIQNLNKKMIMDKTKGYSASDLTSIANDTKMEPIMKIVQSKYFKQVGGCRWEICSHNSQGAICCSYKDIPDWRVQILHPAITMNDILVCIDAQMRTVDTKGETWYELEEFCKKYTSPLLAIQMDLSFLDDSTPLPSLPQREIQVEENELQVVHVQNVQTSFPKKRRNVFMRMVLEFFEFIWESVFLAL